MLTSDWILVFATIVQASAAIAIVILAYITLRVNRVLAADNRRLVGAEVEPEVVAYLAQEKSGREEHVYVIVENIGRGPATSVSAELEAPGDDFVQYSFNKRLARAEGRKFDIRFLPPGVRAKFFLRNRVLKSAAGTTPPFEVSVHYQDLRSKLFEKRYKMDIEQVSRGWNIERS